MTKTNEVAAIILAAGRSERMGAFKPLLPFGSQTVIGSCIKLLRDGGVETVVVVLGHDPRADDLKQHLKDSRVSFAVNPDATSEMSASIACGVRELTDSAKAVVITPADHPAVPAEVVERLISEWRQGARLVMPIWKGHGGHPVLIDLGFRRELLSLDPNRGLKALFDVHRDDLRRVDVDSNYIARDMDTWDDYAALHQEVFGVPPPKAPYLKQ
ncbi:MAG: nucleotidyltransferase family protein [Acidobacteriota bacterium]|nr:nucleotidyltransferase family protein [Acidobacteriota bacterium]